MWRILVLSFRILESALCIIWSSVESTLKLLSECAACRIKISVQLNNFTYVCVQRLGLSHIFCCFAPKYIHVDRCLFKKYIISCHCQLFTRCLMLADQAQINLHPSSYIHVDESIVSVIGSTFLVISLWGGALCYQLFSTVLTNKKLWEVTNCEK